MYTPIDSYIFSQELNSRAQGEVSIREALRELELWGTGAVFSLTSYVDSHNKELSIIKDWKDLVNQVQKNKLSHTCISQYAKFCFCLSNYLFIDISVKQHTYALAY